MNLAAQFQVMVEFRNYEKLMDKYRALDKRVKLQTLPNGLSLYKVKLVGGPCDGAWSICSADTVIARGEKYLRGKDDRYYHCP